MVVAEVLSEWIEHDTGAGFGEVRMPAFVRDYQCLTYSNAGADGGAINVLAVKLDDAVFAAADADATCLFLWASRPGRFDSEVPAATETNKLRAFLAAKLQPGETDDLMRQVSGKTRSGISETLKQWLNSRP